MYVCISRPVFRKLRSTWQGLRKHSSPLSYVISDDSTGITSCTFERITSVLVSHRDEREFLFISGIGITAEDSPETIAETGGGIPRAPGAECDPKGADPRGLPMAATSEIGAITTTVSGDRPAGHVLGQTLGLAAGWEMEEAWVDLATGTEGAMVGARPVEVRLTFPPVPSQCVDDEGRTTVADVPIQPLWGRRVRAFWRPPEAERSVENLSGPPGAKCTYCPRRGSVCSCRPFFC